TGIRAAMKLGRGPGRHPNDRESWFRTLFAEIDAGPIVRTVRTVRRREKTSWFTKKERFTMSGLPSSGDRLESGRESSEVGEFVRSANCWFLLHPKQPARSWWAGKKWRLNSHGGRLALPLAPRSGGQAARVLLLTAETSNRLIALSDRA